MFCYQCQEALGNKGCNRNGMCGKKGPTADMQDLLIYTVKGVSVAAEKAGRYDEEVVDFVRKALFTTVTNVSFDDERILETVKKGLALRDRIISEAGLDCGSSDVLTWNCGSEDEFRDKADKVGVLNTENEDVRSLRELLTYGVKGIAAYADHAAVLGYSDPAVNEFMIKALAATTKDISADELTSMVLAAGNNAVSVMALLDKAHTETYGSPEISEVNLGVGQRPGILISGHDMKDMQELLEQTENTGVDVYTHGEMLPANYYPAFKKFDHFIGNYGNSWWAQDSEFEAFNGPILMTTNCLVPPKDSYKDKVFTTSVVAFPGMKHIPDRPEGGSKDFSKIIEMAKQCGPPKELETGKLVGGFAHNQVMQLADKVVDAVKSGAVRKFVVMAGCDGRHDTRNYYTEFAKQLPSDTIILTAGCAKYRYNKLDLGDIGGIPRVLDAGQCNDSYSLALIALKLKEVFELEDINDLPIVYNVAWYEQKAVTVLLALLALGVKNIHLGPTLPAFLSENVANVLVEKFDISPISTVEEDMKKLVG
ncbi:hydroxylamine reductase [Sedimentisphaera salicampi]|uniref:Hydroxylamine reductase n=1 Tax=Sedimentisphaera salicampi TaxID=1941349 RepID=A0A1W6LLC6_9BACT|nr:hydroxylamine reductase [Sedimentisphaera salicampi]ARN56579.1 Hydroxylamine reductase [Sedimentisphaera salicampi]